MKPSTVFGLLLLAFLVVMAFAGCASTFPYHGDDLYPRVSVEVFRHVDSVTNPRQPTWIADHIVTITNPTNLGVSFDIDCRNGTSETYHGMDIPAHTGDSILIPHDEGGCDIKRVPARNPNFPASP